MGHSRPLFVYFRPFLVTASIQIEKIIDGVLWIRTRGRRMVGTDETTELWRPPTGGGQSFNRTCGHEEVNSVELFQPD